MKALQGLVARRKAAGASQTQIAELMGLYQPNVSRIESLLETGGNLTTHTVQRYVDAIEAVEAAAGGAA